jgi:hypothetical protein
MRVPYIAIENGKIIATVSLIKDSQMGLPADSFQPKIIQRLRDTGEYLAEVSALAVDQDCRQQRNLVLFLFKFLYQHSFYYAGIDRFLAIAVERHGIFYESICCFQPLSVVGGYDYVQVPMKLLALPLIEAHRYFYERYEADTGNRNNFYRFMLNEDPNMEFPETEPLYRSRRMDWLVQSYGMEMPLAV